MKTKKCFIVLASLLLLASCEDTSDTATSASEGEISQNSEKASETVEPPASDSFVSDSTENEESASESTEPIDTQEQYAELWGDEIAQLMRDHLYYIIPYIDLGKPLATWDTTTYTDTSFLSIETGKGTTDYNDYETRFRTPLEEDGWVVNTTYAVTSTTGYTATLASKGLSLKLTADEYTSYLECYYDEPYDESTITDWPAVIKDGFAVYGDSHDLPFFYLGTATPTLETSPSYAYKIIGGKYDARISTAGQTAFTTDGWTVTMNTSSSYYNYDVFTAKKTFSDDCIVSVTLTKSSSSSRAKAELQVSIKEAWNPNKSTGAWPQAVLDTMNNTWGTTFPYVYLGSTNPTATAFAYSSEVDILGGAWDDAVEGYLDAEFASWTDWTVTKDGEDTGTMTAKYTMLDPNGGQWRFELRKNSNEMICPWIYYTAPFVQTSNDWTQEIKDAFDQYLNGHSADIPFVFLNTDTPTFSFNSYSDKLTVTGSTYYDIIGTNFDTAYTQAGWTQNSSDIGYSIIKSYTKIINGDILTVGLSEGSSYSGCYMEFTCLESWDTNKSQGSWDQTILDTMNNTWGTTFPYIYLGATNPTATPYSSSREVDIKGGAWDDAVLDYVTAQFNSWTGWTWTYTDTENTSGNIRNYSGSDPLNNRWRFNIYKTSGRIYAWIYFTPAMTITSTAWDQTTVDALNTHLDNHAAEIPFVFLNSDTPSTSWYGTSSYLTVTGGTWNDDIVDLFDTAYSTANWNCLTGTGDYDDPTYQKVFDDNCLITAVLDIPATISGTATIKYYIKKAYDPTKGSGSYSQTAISTMQSAFNNHTIPYIYLGDDNSSWSSSTSFGGYVYTTVSQWDDAVVTQAQQAFLADNADGIDWIIDIDDGLDNYGHNIQAMKTFADGYTLRVIIYPSNPTNLDSSALNLYIYGSTATTSSTATDWSQNVKDAMTAQLNGNTIPYFDLGTPLTTLDTSTAREVDIKFTSSNVNYNCNYLLNAQDVLKADGWETDFHIFTPYHYTSWKETGTLEAKKKLDDGSQLTMVYEYYTPQIRFMYTPAFNPPTDEADKVWTDEVQAALSANFADFNIPYIYLGTMAPTVSEFKDGKLTITGDIWSDELLTLFVNEFTGATAKEALYSDDGNTLVRDEVKWGTPTINRINKSVYIAVDDPDNAGYFLAISVEKQTINSKDVPVMTIMYSH